MNSKEQKIKEEYGQYYELVSKFIDDDGWCTQLDYSSGSEVKNHPCLNELGFTKDDGLLDSGYFSEENKHKWRPKSLQGIENNAGWIKIESEDDLPTEDNGEYWMIERRTKDIVYETDLMTHNKTFIVNYFTHYQPITKPEPPLH